MRASAPKANSPALRTARRRPNEWGAAEINSGNDPTACVLRAHANVIFNISISSHQSIMQIPAHTKPTV